MLVENKLKNNFYTRSIKLNEKNCVGLEFKVGISLFNQYWRAIMENTDNSICYKWSTHPIKSFCVHSSSSSSWTWTSLHTTCLDQFLQIADINSDTLKGCRDHYLKECWSLLWGIHRAEHGQRSQKYSIHIRRGIILNYRKFPQQSREQTLNLFIRKQWCWVLNLLKQSFKFKLLNDKLIWVKTKL